MNIWQVFSKVGKSKKFYIWVILYIGAGLIFRIMPQQARTTICTMYIKWIEPQILDGIRDVVGLHVSVTPEVSPAVTEADLTVSDELSATNMDIKSVLRAYVCAGTSPQGVMPLSAVLNFDIIMQIMGGAIVLALISTLLFPFGGKENGEAQPPVLWQAPRDAFRRNNRLHIGLAYAFLSCLACVLVPPLFGPKESFSILDQLPHLAALIAGAALAAVWGTWRYYRTDASAVVVGLQLAFSGVFASSLIALLIAMPYRIMTSVDGAALSFEQVKIFTIIRLLVLPSIAAMSAIAGIVALRWFHNVPTKWIGAVQPA